MNYLALHNSSPSHSCGAATPAGKRLRLYWQPVALAEKLVGSLADLLQPDRQQQPLEDRARNFVVIMKDGKIFRNN